jgi:hypothetical protein
MNLKFSLSSHIQECEIEKLKIFKPYKDFSSVHGSSALDRLVVGLSTGTGVLSRGISD